MGLALGAKHPTLNFIVLKKVEFAFTYPLFGKSLNAADELLRFVNEKKLHRQDIIAINRDYDGSATLWYWEVTPQEHEEIKRAVAQVCLKPGDPLE